MAKTPAKKKAAAPKAKAKAKGPVADTPQNHKIAANTVKQLERLHALNLMSKAKKPEAKKAARGVDLSGEGKRGSAAKDF